jgi:hypothetical protein
VPLALAKPGMSKMPASATCFSSTRDIVMGNGMKINIRKCISPGIPSLPRQGKKSK